MSPHGLDQSDESPVYTKKEATGGELPKKEMFPVIVSKEEQSGLKSPL